MTREQAVALILLGVLFLVAVGIVTIKVVWFSDGVGLDELPG